MSNMYEWTSGDKGITWNPVAGECPHKCRYCYVNNLKRRSRLIADKYSGKLRTDPNTIIKKFPPGKTVFVCSCNDLFAREMGGITVDVLDHISKFPETQFLLQSKNPSRIEDFMGIISPKNTIIGTTIETDEQDFLQNIQSCPKVENRLGSIEYISSQGYRTMISIEPIIKFGSAFPFMIVDTNPSFVSIGADSKHNRLPEPDREDTERLIRILREHGIEVRLKPNLKRIVGE